MWLMGMANEVYGIHGLLSSALDKNQVSTFSFEVLRN